MLQAAEHASAAVDDPTPRHWTNLVQNPSFETCQNWFRDCWGSSAHWSPINEPDAVEVHAVRSTNTSRARYGSYFGEISTQLPGGSVGQGITTPVPTGTTYRFEMWVRPSSSPLPFDGTLALWALGGSHTDEHAEAAFTANPRVWTLVSVDLTVSTPHSMLRAEIYMNSTYQTFAFDGAQVVRTGLDHGSGASEMSGVWLPGGPGRGTGALRI